MSARRVLGINSLGRIGKPTLWHHDADDPARHNLISVASCTTIALAHMMRTLIGFTTYSVRVPTTAASVIILNVTFWASLGVEGNLNAWAAQAAAADYSLLTDFASPRPQETTAADANAAARKRWREPVSRVSHAHGGAVRHGHHRIRWTKPQTIPSL